ASLAEKSVSSEYISKFVMIGSPSSFTQTTMPWEFFPMIQLHELPLWLGSGEKPVVSMDLAKRFSNGLRNFHNTCLGFFCAPIVNWLARGVVRPENFSSSDDWNERAVSHSIPRDILRSFNLFRLRGFPHANAKL